MKKKILKAENITAASQFNNKNSNIEETKKVDKALIYGEMPLRTYELLRNNFIGIK